MAFDGYWTAREVIALREAMRRGPYAFADFIGVTARSVLCWEDGSTKRIRAASQELLDNALKRAGPDVRARFDRILTYPSTELQRFRAALEEDANATGFHVDIRPMIAITDEEQVRLSGVDAGEAEDNEVKRREFGNAMVGSAAVVGGYPELDRSPRIGTSDARRLLDIADQLARQDQRVGGAALVEAAQQHLAHAKTILETCEFSGRAGAAFLSATGTMADRVGWLAFDAENHRLAYQSYSDALALANLAGDDELTAYTCLNMAMQLVNLSRRGKGSPQYALRLTARARDLTHGLPSGRIHALVAVREATAHAALGDRMRFSRAITSAWREMDRAAEHEPITECPVWLQFVSHAEVRFHEAKGLGYLGDMSRCVELHADVANSRAGARNAAGYRAALAAGLAQTGDVSAAVGEALPVVDNLEDGVSSPRILRVLDVVRQAAGAHSSHEEFRIRYDELVGQAGGVA